MTTKRKIKNALVLLESIGKQMTKLDSIRTPKNLAPLRFKLSDIGVRLRLRGNEDILLDTSLSQAIYYLAGDTYWNEESDWSNAEVAEVYIL